MLVGGEEFGSVLMQRVNVLWFVLCGCCSCGQSPLISTVVHPHQRRETPPPVVAANHPIQVVVKKEHKPKFQSRADFVQFRKRSIKSSGRNPSSAPIKTNATTLNSKQKKKKGKSKKNKTKVKRQSQEIRGK